MRNVEKKAVITGAAFCVFGLVLFGAGKLSGGTEYIKHADLNKITGNSIHTASSYFSLEKTELPEVEFLQVDLDDVDFVIQPSGDEKYYLSYEAASAIDYETSEGTLVIKEDLETSPKTYVQIDINYICHLLGMKECDDKNEVVLYVPENHLFTDSTISLEYGDLSFDHVFLEKATMNLDSGNLSVLNAHLRDSSMTNTYGNVSVEQSAVSGGTFTLEDGDLELVETVLDQDVVITNNYGNVTLGLKADCVENTDFILDTYYGSIDVQKELAGNVSQTSDEDASHYEKRTEHSTGSLKVEVADGDIILK